AEPMASAFHPALVNKIGPSVNVGRWPADQNGSSQYPLLVFVQMFSANDDVIAADQKAKPTAQATEREDLLFIAGKVAHSSPPLKWVLRPSRVLRPRAQYMDGSEMHILYLGCHEALVHLAITDYFPFV